MTRITTDGIIRMKIAFEMFQLYIEVTVRSCSFIHKETAHVANEGLLDFCT